MDNKKVDLVEKTPEENVADLEEKYDRPFEVVEVEDGGVTVAGRLVADRFLMKSTEDGTLFRYVVQPDGEIDDYFVHMYMGNKYYEEVLVPELDEIYGTGNYVGQVILVPDRDTDISQNLEQYNSEEDSNKTVKLFLAIKTSSLELNEESIKASKLYNTLKDFRSKVLQIGYFTSFPEDEKLRNFLVYEATGKHDAFSLFFKDQMLADLIIFSQLEGNDLDPAAIEELITPLEEEE